MIGQGCNGSSVSQKGIYLLQLQTRSQGAASTAAEGEGHTSLKHCFSV